MVNHCGRSRWIVSVVLAGVCGLSGCVAVPGYYEGGSRASNDQHVYVSRTWEPKTVWITDTRTGETLWSVDVPVGQKLVIRFIEDQNPDNPVLPAIMRWELMDDSRMFGELANAMPVPDRSSRLIEWRLRAVPEYPPDATGAR